MINLKAIASLIAGLLLSASSLLILGCAGDPYRESTGEYIDDATITTKVKARLAKDPLVKARQVSVETFKSVVQLSGFVDTQEEADQAERLASDVKGVKSVKNDLVVKPVNP